MYTRFAGKTKIFSDMRNERVVAIWDHDSIAVPSQYREGTPNQLLNFLGDNFPFAGVITNGDSFSSRLGDDFYNGTGLFGSAYPSGILSYFKRFNPVTNFNEDVPLEAPAIPIQGAYSGADLLLGKLLQNSDVGVAASGAIPGVPGYTICSISLELPNGKVFPTNPFLNKDVICRPTIIGSTGGHQINGILAAQFRNDQSVSGTIVRTVSNIWSKSTTTQKTSYFTNPDTDGGTDLTTTLHCSQSVASGPCVIFYIPNHANITSDSFFVLGPVSFIINDPNTKGLIMWPHGHTGRRTKNWLDSAIETPANLGKNISAMSQGHRVVRFVQTYFNDWFQTTDADHPGAIVTSRAQAKQDFNDLVDLSIARGVDTVVFLSNYDIQSAHQDNRFLPTDDNDLKIEIARERPDKVAFINGFNGNPKNPVINLDHEMSVGSGGVFTYFIGHANGDATHPGTAGTVMMGKEYATNILMAADDFDSRQGSLTMGASSGTFTSSNWSNNQLIILIQGGCRKIIIGVRKSNPSDAPTYTDGIFVNVDAIHENTEPGASIFKGGQLPFETTHDSITKITITAMNNSAIPTIDFAVTAREKVES